MAFTRGTGGPISEINVTPMVDVMLVLLVIFMVTAPLLQQGVKVDLPDANAEPMKTSTEERIADSREVDQSRLTEVDDSGWTDVNSADNCGP